MKFSIITPTHKRADKLTRAIDSVLLQTYSDWEMIIVNDSPDDTSYASFEETISDPRIIYLKNEQNSGVNFSRNRALDSISKDSGWVIFLDDDDWLASDALATFHNLIQKNPNKKWFVTNRAQPDGTPLTLFPTADTSYSYAWDYLITKKCIGDATHCINTTLIKGTRFSTHIKQAEEWIFFYQIGLKGHMFYHNHNSTITDGYDTTSGLNFRKQNKLIKINNTLTLLKEGVGKNIAFRPSFLLYILGKILVTIFK